MGRKRGRRGCKTTVATASEACQSAPVPSKKNRADPRDYEFSSPCQSEDDENALQQPEREQVDDKQDIGFVQHCKDVKAVLGEEICFVGGSRKVVCRVQWNSNYEPYDRMKKQHRQLFKEYMERKSAKVISVVSGTPGTAAEVSASIVFNIEVSGKRQQMNYLEVRRRFPDALLDFYLKQAEYDRCNCVDCSSPDLERSPEL
ncbi:hypothetical protein QR680_015934 [Steinernema hermaphroditum]|uniref:Uncharacterized protein n=1 Tax=Steinernema hermaphroditum TaxID=289476 RepID=A0AA39HAE7_9BILA|nr:hypothetical protein QR680_015934 [Steinernema hermaphroditum]